MYACILQKVRLNAGKEAKAENNMNVRDVLRKYFSVYKIEDRVSSQRINEWPRIKTRGVPILDYPSEELRN